MGIVRTSITLKNVTDDIKAQYGLIKKQNMADNFFIHTDRNPGKMARGFFLLLAFAVCFLNCAGSRSAKETDIEKITVVNGAVPVYKFVIPQGDAFGNYTKITALFLVDAENYRKQARVRAYGNYPSGFFSELDDMIFLDFGGGDKDRNGPYLVSNVIGTNRDLSAVSGRAGPNSWFTLDFPLHGREHPNYDFGNFPGNDASGELYFPVGLGTSSATVSFTYYVKEVALVNDDGSKKIVSQGSGFGKPAFAGYPDSIPELSRIRVSGLDLSSLAQDAGNTGYYLVRQIYPWLYSIYDPENVYCYLAVGEERALLYDTVYGIGSLSDAVKEITDKPVIVVLGHGHGDHVNGAFQFGEAWLHEADFALCRAGTTESVRRNILDRMEMDGQILPEGFDKDAYINAGAGNLKELETGRVFDLGGLHIEVVAMEGHTAGSVGLLAREHRVLLDSDAASSHTWMFLNESLTMSRYIAMLERTFLLDFDTFFVGHSDVPYPKTHFQKIINVARNATVEKAEPYNPFPNAGALSYQEDGVLVAFSAEKL